MERGGGQSPSSSEQGGDVNHNNANRNPPSTPDSPTSAGFNTDQLSFNTSSTSENYTDDEDEAAVDPEIIRDEPEEVDEEEEEVKDLFNDNFMEDYRRMEEHDQYESVWLDESLEDERDLDQILYDRRATEVELEPRDGHTSQLLHDQGANGHMLVDDE